MSTEENKAVYLSANLYGRVEERLSNAGFGSVDEYVIFVLEEVLKDDEEDTVAFTKEEEEEVKQRLRALGYLD
ncbi:MAG: CopG family transcriptional regulator [Dehalococcoidia bacterium]